ncbi:LSP1 protein, partial [Hippolais icterina]|nr:LSP1 protein [Hippolais icterina]
RLTAQWSMEDEEEAARERRRREREKQLRSQAEEGLSGTVSCSESTALPQNHYDFNASGTLDLEEDEGFSDWSQKLEQCKQRSPRQSCEEEDSGVMEAQVKPEQIQLDQESPEENVVVREEERLCQEEEEAQEQEEEAQGEQAEKEEKKRKRNYGVKEEQSPEKRLKASSLASLEEEEEDLSSDHIAVCFRKIRDRTELLNHSIQESKESSKSQPLLPVPKIGDRLEQYTQAVEASTKAPKPVRHPSLDIPIASKIVARTKRLWETGEITAQSAVMPSSSKDTVVGDLVSTRSLWEQKGNPKPESSIKSIPSCRRYKFVKTGHGRYKKVLIDDTAEQ